MMAVSVETRGNVAIVTIDNPPVNAASQAVRAGLLEAIASTEADGAVRAVVLRAVGRTFTAGADVREFVKPPLEPHLPDVILALEGASKPWVAALHGSALGGGLEIALGCGYRVADGATHLGVPEVTLGLIPGAGGTVRLPRLIDPTEALQLIAGGKPVTAQKALALGLIDGIVQGDVTDHAVKLARDVPATPPVPLSQRDPRVRTDPEAWDKAKSAISARARGAHAPIAAIEAVEDALNLPARQALATERARFMALKSDAQSAALRHIFFAERSTAKLDVIKDVAPQPLSTIGVVGGGTMGAGISAACLLTGLSVVLVERDEAARDAGSGRVADILAGSLKRGLIDQATHEAHLGRLRTATRYDALGEADLVIEAVFEEMEIKHQVFAELDRHVRPDAVLASNTSYLDINEIAARTRHPSRVIGLHFFSPAHIMKLLEVIVTDAATPSALATGFALGRRLGKIAVPAGVCDGFIGNRIMSAYRRACEYMVEDGALPWDVDAAMRRFGFPMGLFEMQDLAGLDISWAMRKRQTATRDPAMRYVALGDRLCEAGRFGRKAGKGWYDYDEGRARPSDWVEALILSEARGKGITRRAFAPEEIMSRIITAMQREADALLSEGIARRGADIDVVMVNGYGFPRWRGGPCFMQSQSETEQ